MVDVAIVLILATTSFSVLRQDTQRARRVGTTMASLSVTPLTRKRTPYRVDICCQVSSMCKCLATYCITHRFTKKSIGCNSNANATTKWAMKFSWTSLSLYCQACTRWFTQTSYPVSVFTLNQQS